jgi:hypothetical protein
MGMRDLRLARCFQFFVALFSCLLLSCAVASCQDGDSPSIGAFAGAGLQLNGTRTGSFQVGGSFDQSAPNHWIGYIFECGYEGSFTNLHSGSALFSVNYFPSWHLRSLPSLYPFATVGYTQLFGTGNAVNFGAGVDVRLSTKLSVRLEGRNYFGLVPQQNNFAVRIGLRRYFWD